MAVDQVLHPLLELGSDQVFNVRLCKLLLENLILVSDISNWEGDFNQVPFNGEWLSFEPQVLLLIEYWHNGYKLWPVLKLHKVSLHDPDLLLESLHGQDIVVDLQCLRPHHGCDWIEVGPVTLQVYVFYIEFILVILVGFLLKYINDPVDKLLRLALVFEGLLLHVAGDVLPLVEAQVSGVWEACHQRFDADIESWQLDLPQEVVLFEAALKVSCVLVQ